MAEPGFKTRDSGSRTHAQGSSSILCSHCNGEWKNYHFDSQFWYITSTEQLPVCWMRRYKFSAWGLMVMCSSSLAFFGHIRFYWNFLLRSPCLELTELTYPLGISFLLLFASRLFQACGVGVRAQQESASIMRSRRLFWHLGL